MKEAIKRSAELVQTLDETQLLTISRAKSVLSSTWPFLDSEPDLSDELRERAAALQDILQRETFFRELAAIDQHAHALDDEYAKRHTASAKERCEAYEAALTRLKGTPGWDQLDPEQQEQVSAVLRSRAADDGAASIPIALLREQTQACGGLLDRAEEEMLRIVDGTRIERLDVASYFAGGIETEEQLEAALEGLRERVAELIAAGKKVLIQ